MMIYLNFRLPNLQKTNCLIHKHYKCIYTEITSTEILYMKYESKNNG